MGGSAGTRRRLTVGGVALGVAAAAVVAGIVTTPSALADKAGGHNPKGNNGTFKVDGVPFDDGIDNEPHVACEFRLVFFGFDKDQRGTIEFTGQPPSGRGRVGGLNNVLLSDDDAGGGLNDRDAIFNFDADDLDLSRLQAHPKQGYHIKVTVLTGEPGGKKHKVFWLQPCAAPTPSPTVSPTETTSPPTTGSPTVSPTQTETTPPVSPTATETPGPTGTSTPSPSVSGVVTTAPGVPGATPSATVSGVVLTTAPSSPDVLGRKQTRGAGGLALSGFATLGLIFAGLALLGAGVIAVVAVRRHGAIGTG